MAVTALGMGQALGLASSGAKILGSRRREKKANQAQAKAQAADRAIRDEQAGRARRTQARNAVVQAANVEAGALASGTTGGSGEATATSGIQSNLAANLGNLNTSIAAGELQADVQTDINNAGLKTSFETVNDFANPLILNNMDGISNAFNAAFGGG
jgi:hypothetical protein